MANNSFTDQADQEMTVLASRVMTHFLIPPDDETLFAKFSEQTKEVKAPFRAILEAFRSNIVGLVTTVTFPFSLAFSAALDRKYQAVTSSEHIRALKMNQKEGESEIDLEVRRKTVTEEVISKRMDDLFRTTEGQTEIKQGCLSFLRRASEDVDLVKAANELVLQGMVLCWSAFEILARDTFVALLNLQPHLAVTLLNDPVAKKRFELSKIPFEMLAEHGYDLSGKIGNILSQQQDLSDLISIKVTYDALFSKDQRLRDALSEIDLRVLSQSRNLIVHRSGIIDEAYIKVVKSQQGIGDKLKVHPDEVLKYITCSASAASAILLAASDSWNVAKNDRSIV